ncbi:MAG: tRNA dihydrouridine synthase DusB [Balneola sp.]|nr:tRNA dihydrouridine synthase DusB [Balneola sp.]MBO6649532.1 tRNA dihydrouridine synthase DusB [Balneola sp.]MBO6711349.1 tRNA dihydrouridine synthase DusB [Balneola sp.]MBO6801297.1 tRNA dihydrouridine synthase DusB [Balneola sp.]MBO6869285.1 tRNA dihydrouridine synthase DusB [Balneola sp.]
MNIDDITLPKKPLFLAPMEDVTDSPFRQICREKGADIVFTEFISSEALIRDSEIALHKMSFDESERPFGVQIFGGREEAMHGAAKVALNNNPDVVDINFGCPVYKVVNKGAGAACLKDLDMMERMAGTVVDAVTDRPVTVKTRLGWDDDTIKIQEVALMLQKLGVKALTVHARTRCQKYKGDARWEWLKKLKNTPGLEIPIIGNGDVTSPELAKKMFDETGVDGVMIGRGAIGNPWIFEQSRHYLETGELLPEPTLEEKLNVCAEQLRKSVVHQGEKYGVVIMKKHYGQYLKGIYNGKKLRMELMKHDTMDPILEILLNFKEEDSFALA